MSIIKMQLKQLKKPFLLWTVGLFAMVVGGLVKYTGINSATDDSMSKLLESFPKAFLAVFGMSGIDIETLGGYYATLQFYVLIMVAIFALWLGSMAVAMESIDKTYEFLFTKPCSRTLILAKKLGANIGVLLLFCLMNVAASVVGLMIYGIENTIQTTIYLYGFSSLMVGVFFFFVGMFLSTILPKRKGYNAGVLVFFVCYMLSIAYDMSEDFEFVRCLTPFKYFMADDLINGSIDVFYVVVILIVSLALSTVGFVRFNKSDLS